MSEVGKWKKIKKTEKITGHIATYYSNDKAKLPVRDVKRLWDSKADPNIETGTYGIFTTCMPASRKNMVQRGDSYIFFFTNWRGKRYLAGYYELDKYIDTGITPTGNGKAYKYSDYGLVAKRTHFVAKPIPFTGKLWSKINPEKCSEDGIDGYGPRNFKAIDEKLTKKLKMILDLQPDITAEYVKEIKKLEKENADKYGFKYPSWNRPDGFTKKDVKEFIPSLASPPKSNPSSDPYVPMKEGHPKLARDYQCTNCGWKIGGQMCQLKKCERCGEFSLKQV